MQIALGCQNRPWHQYTLEEALAGIAAAGFTGVGLIPQQGKWAFTADSSDEDIEALRRLLDSHRLQPEMAIRQPNLWELPEARAVSAFLREMDRGKALGLEYFILTGMSHEDRYESWFRAIGACLDRAAELGLQLLLKPHGGLSALAADLRGAIERFHHPSFGICYDPGNILYYTGEKPEEDLPGIVEHVRAMCIKDEVGGREGEVMITPGTGLVDFPRIFTILREAGFAGPCWVECLGGETLAEINDEARRAQQFITEVVAAV